LHYPRPGARTHGRVAMASADYPRHARSSLPCQPTTRCPPRSAPPICADLGLMPIRRWQSRSGHSARP
jgi:hypothetical protein